MPHEATRFGGTKGASDAIGAVVFGALSVWGLVSATVSGGRPAPLLSVVIGSWAALVGGRRLARWSPPFVLGAVVATPVVAAGISGADTLWDGPLGYENASGALFLIAAAAAVVLMRTLADRRWRRAAFGVAVVWVLAAWFLGARTAAFLGPLVLVSALLRGSLRQVRAVLAIGIVVTALGLVLAGGLGVAYDPGGRAGALDQAVDATLGEVRVALWHDATRMIRSAPITGVGPGQFEKLSTISNGDEVGYAHNEYLHVTAELGVPGGVLLLAAIGWVLARVWRAPSGSIALPVAIALVASTLNANIDYVWHFSGVLFPLAALVGTAVATPARVTEGGLLFVSEHTRGAFLATVLLFLLCMLPWHHVNPPITIANGAAWAHEETGIRFTGVGGLLSRDAPAELYKRLGRSQEISIDMEIVTTDVAQAGPARLVTMSDGVLERNLTIGQEEDRLVLRLRTTTTDRNATDAEVVVRGVFQAGQTQRLLVVMDRHGVRLYVDGDLRWLGAGPGGRLDNWNHRYSLVVGNEATGDRGWRGVMQFLAIYDVAVEAEQVDGLAADEHSQELELEPVAMYRFDEAGASRIRDRSDAGAGGDLTLPDRFPSPPTGYLDTLLDSERVRPPRMLWFAGLFALWAAVVWPPVPADRGQRAGMAAAVLLGGLALALVASALRYLSDRAPSILDVTAAAFGIAIAVIARLARSR